MPNKRRNKRAKREQRRVRHNQNKKEGTVMTENIGGTTDSTVTEVNQAEEMEDITVEKVTAEEIPEITTDKAEIKEDQTEEEAAEVTEDKSTDLTEVNTETIETEYKDREENKVESKEEEVTVTKEASHKLYIQYNDLEFSDELMFEAAVNAYCNEYGQDKSSVEAVNLYVKPQEGKAYYVINNDAEKTGSIDL